LNFEGLTNSNQCSNFSTNFDVNPRTKFRQNPLTYFVNDGHRYDFFIMRLFCALRAKLNKKVTNEER
jgi:hypothetical protein